MPPPKERLYTSEDYWGLPESRRAELIDGQLYDIAPPSRIHQEIISAMNAVIYHYLKSRGGNCKVYPAQSGLRGHELGGAGHLRHL